jgi:hypothetical protein
VGKGRLKERQGLKLRTNFFLFKKSPKTDHGLDLRKYGMFHIKTGLIEEDALLSLLFNFAVEYAIRKVKTNHKLLKFNGTDQVIIYVDINL